MCEQKKCCIYPNKWIVFALVLATLVAGLLAFSGYKGHAPIAPSPVLLFIIGLLALIYYCRIIQFNHGCIIIHYCLLFLKRKVSVERVNSVEYIHYKNYEYLLISLDDCQCFSKSGMSINSYIWRHPIKLVTYRFPAGNHAEQLNIITDHLKEVRHLKLTAQGKLLREDGFGKSD